MTSIKNSLRRTGVKLAAWALLLAALVGAAGGGIAVVISTEYGLYESTAQDWDGVDYTASGFWQSKTWDWATEVEQMAQALLYLDQQGIELQSGAVQNVHNWTLEDLLPEGNRNKVIGYEWGDAVLYGDYVANNIEWRYYNTHSNATNFRYRMTLTLQDGSVVTISTPTQRGFDQPYAFEDGKAVQQLAGDGYTILCGVDQSFPVQDSFSAYASMLQIFFPYRWVMLGVLAVCTAVSLVLAVYLLVFCGKRPETDAVALTLFDRIPGDLMVCGMAVVAGCGIGLGIECMSVMYRPTAAPCYLFGGAAALLIGGACWLSMLSLASLVTRARARTLWRNTLLARFGGAVWGWWKTHLGGKLKDGCKYGVRYIRAGGAARIGLAAVLLAIFATCLLGFFFGLLWGSVEVITFAILFSILWGAAALVALGQMMTLDKGACELANGNLNHKIETETLWIGFKEHAEHLNAIADGMNTAVENRMKSERLKTELLTNVSHDIKTPLTSIINYVDLLRACDLQDEKAREYVDVLDRQSKRLKKLLEDLLEASKASTGNIRAELAPTDAGELLRQAVGEYEERLTAAGITPVVTIPDEPATVLADGRLLWRIFDNLLNNIVKYSLSGTRAYLALTPCADSWQVTFKNISREPLNIAADELMERFVRGDASRTTEGNGLGLSIARSLAECMHVGFEIGIDGDLFRASVTLPGVKLF